MGKIEAFFEKYKGVRRLSVLSGIALLWFCGYTVHQNPDNVSASAATVLCSLITASGGLIGLYKWSRSKEDKTGDSDATN